MSNSLNPDQARLFAKDISRQQKSPLVEKELQEAEVAAFD